MRLEPASQPQNLRAEPQKLERVTPRSTPCTATALTLTAVVEAAVWAVIAH